jgi:hypothetical protein
MPINANPAQAMAQLQSAVNGVNTASGTMTIDGNPTLANGKTTAAVTFANGSKGTVTIDGNQTPANGKINATVTYANGRTGIIKVDANAAAANRAIDHAARPRSSTITMTYRVVGAPGGARKLSNSGGYAGGGVVGYAGGGIAGAPLRARRGLVVPGYEPGVDRVPAVLSRGESVLVPELTRKLGARRILAANSAASGGREATVIGQIAGMMDGSLDRMASPAAQAARSPGMATQMRAAVAVARPVATGGGGPSGAAVVAAVDRLTALVRSQYTPPGAGVTEPIVAAIGGAARLVAASGAVPAGQRSQSSRTAADFGAW